MIPPPSQLLYSGQNTRQILSALDCDLCSLDYGLETRSIRHSYGRDVVSTRCPASPSQVTAWTLHVEASPYRPPHVLGILVRIRLRQAHHASDSAPQGPGSARAATTVTLAADFSADTSAPGSACGWGGGIFKSAEADSAAFSAAASICHVGHWSGTSSCCIASLCPVPD